jgi:hypothetical protein
MLHQLRRTGIEDVREHALERQVWRVVGLAGRAGPLERPMALGRSNPEAEPQQAHTLIREAFDRSDGLFVIGPPGVGKTTMLLEFAHGLLDRADHDVKQPIPVVLNLSSWDQRRLPLDQWLVQELQHAYHVPKRIAEGWVSGHHILPLLDGLDEVDLDLRADCMTKIDEFRRTCSTRLVVRSCTQTYEALPDHLQWPNALEIQPLTGEQVDRYMRTVGGPLAEAYAALPEGNSLRRLLRSRLMLYMAILAYHGKSEQTNAFPPNGTLEQWRSRLHKDYNDRMFDRWPIPAGYTQAQAIGCLAWFAAAMRRHHHSEFRFDRLPPGWLPSSAQRRRATLLTAALSGMIGGLPVGLVYGLVYGLVFGRGAGLLLPLFAGLRAGLGSCLVFALITISGGRSTERLDVRGWSFIGLVVSLVGVYFPRPNGLAFALVAIAARSVYELVRAHIASVEGRHRPGWFGRRDIVLVVEIVIMVAVPLATALFPGIVKTWGFWGLLTSLVILRLSGWALDVRKPWRGGAKPGQRVARPGLVAALGGRRAQRGAERAGQATPDREVRRWARRTLAGGMHVGLRIAPILAAALVPGFLPPLGLRLGLVFGVGSALVYGLVFGVVFTLESGGVALLRHVALRWCRVHHDDIAPWYYEGFADVLDDAADRLILRRTPTGYAFVHRSLLEHLAKRDGAV